MSEWFSLKVAVVGALILGYVDYWLLTQKTTLQMFYAMAANGDFGKYGQLYAWTYTGVSLLTFVLFGFSLALLVWMYRHSRLRAITDVGTGGIGAIASAFGAACPVCGAFLLGLLGVAGGVSIFPLKGLEFHFLSLALIIISLVVMARRAAPLIDGTCATCVVHGTSARGRVHFSLSGFLIGIIIIGLLANYFVIHDVARAMGYKLTPLGVGAVTTFIGELVSPQAKLAKEIISTKLNPDGRTTTVGKWPTITEVPAEPKGMDPVEAAKVVMLPKGTPFYAPEGISFDDAIGALNNWQRYEHEIQLSGDLEARYQKIVSTMTCDYCCGGPTRVTVINNCGCSHSAAYRSIAKYLVKNYGDKYSDDEIIGELQRWKGAWYPKGVVEDYLLATGRGDVLGHDTHGGAGRDGRHGF